MKFTKLVFSDCAISTYYNDFSNSIKKIPLNISLYAIRIHFKRKRSRVKKDHYSKYGFNEALENYYSLPHRKCIIYDIGATCPQENIVYVYKYLGNIYTKGEKNVREYFLDNNYCIHKIENDKYLFYNNALYYFNNEKYQYTDEELDLLLKKHIYKEDNRFKRIKREIDLFEKINNNFPDRKREFISEEVKFEVWRRDEGKCVICGSNENLEFDHIIPFSKGGSNTTRNVQLLCETCNRKKSNQI